MQGCGMTQTAYHLFVGAKGKLRGKEGEEVSVGLERWE